MMSRYTTEGNIENEFEPRSKVLKNKLAIRSVKEMGSLEYKQFIATQVHYQGIVQSDTRFTNSLIREMHRHWLGSIFSWAGEYRTVNLSKGDFVWPPASLVSQNMSEFENSFLKKLTPCHPGLIEQISLHIAKVHAEFLLVHPFREGNGRMARLISDLMALQAGYPAPDFAFDQKRNRVRYLDAVKNGYLQNYEPLAKVVREAIERSKGLLRS